MTIDAYVTNPYPVAIALSADPVIGGMPVTGSVSLSWPAPAGGIWVAIFTDDASLTTVPIQVFVDEGDDTADFSIPTGAELFSKEITIGAIVSGVEVTMSLTVLGLFPNAKIVSVRMTALTLSTDDVVYTVPAGRKAISLGGILHNTNAGTATVLTKFKRGGYTWKIWAGAQQSGILILTGQYSSLTPNQFVGDAGSAWILNPNVTGVDVVLSFLEFDDTSPLTSYFLSTNAGTLANGNNTLRTCPAGYTEFLVGATFLSGTVLAGAVVQYGNESGGTRSISLYNVENGGTPTTHNQILIATTVNNAVNNSAPLGQPSALAEGDSIVISTNASTATQVAIGTFLALPVP